MKLKFYQVIWTLRSFLYIQLIVKLFISFFVLYPHVWRKGSRTVTMSIRKISLSNYDLCQSHDLIDLIEPLVEKCTKKSNPYGMQVVKKPGS